MNFYALLPSNASPEVYPENKTSHFKIQLSQRMELCGQWQAALIEFHYPNTISRVTEGENEIKVIAGEVTDTLRVQPGSYTNRTDFLRAVREAFVSFDNNVRPETYFEETEDGRLMFHPLLNTSGAKVYFSPRLSLQLGLSSPGPFPAHERFHSVHPVDISLGIPSQMFLYMDILSDQIVGHTRAPLLRTVPVDIEPAYGSMSIFHCDHPIYFDLSTKSFDTIQVDIRDHAGRHVPFDFGTSTLLVHFKTSSKDGASK